MPQNNRKQIDCMKQLMLDNWNGKNGQYPIVQGDANLVWIAYSELMNEAPPRRSARLYYEK